MRLFRARKGTAAGERENGSKHGAANAADRVSADEQISADACALAISVIYPVKLVGEAKGGLAAEPALLEDYRSANEDIVAKLAPKCRERKGTGSAGTEQVRYECAAHEVAMSVQPKLDALAARLTASR